MKSTQLTHAFVKSVTRPGRYGDGRGGLGLSLLVKKNAAGGYSKTWSQRLRIGRKLTTRGFGSFPIVTLADARKRALDNARRVYHGEDILKPPPVIPTVNKAFDIVREQRRPSRKGEPKGERTMEITITTTRGRFVLEGIASRTPGLVVTPEIRQLTGSETEIVPKSWTITHEVSGMSICDARNKAKCVWTANKLKDLVDWTNETPADEIKSKGIGEMVNNIITERP